MQRMGMAIGIRPERLAEYKSLHTAPWPDMDAALRAANIQNCSIFLAEPQDMLFAYWEYTGTD
ncbi:MAG: L-rhamnose mutarotase, partial [Paracoccaceae bacterium]